MILKENNYAFIDGQNLNLGIKELGWKLDFKKFRIYLKEKYNVSKAYYFIGFVEGNNGLYSSLQEYGYILIFKPTFKNKEGKIKGNCDAELVLQAMIDYNNFDKAIIVSGDGDFYCLIKYLRERNKLRNVLTPNDNFSGLLKKSAGSNLAVMNDLRNKLEYSHK
jgi:uncharacterized LabA/DUF88 family protein